MSRIIGGALVVVSALGNLIIGVLTSTVAPSWHQPGNAAFNSSGWVLVALHVMLLLGVGTLGGTVVVRGALAKTGFVTTMAALALQIVAEVTLRFSFTAGNALFGIMVPLVGVGFVVLGIAVLRSDAGSGWHRLTPLLCGLYVPVVLLPVFFAIAHGPSFLAIAGWQVFFLLLGVAMASEAQISRRAQVRSAIAPTTSGASSGR